MDKTIQNSLFVQKVYTCVAVIFGLYSIVLGYAIIASLGGAGYGILSLPSFLFFLVVFIYAVKVARNTLPATILSHLSILPALICLFLASPFGEIFSLADWGPPGLPGQYSAYLSTGLNGLVIILLLINLIVAVFRKTCKLNITNLMLGLLMLISLSPALFVTQTLLKVDYLKQAYSQGNPQDCLKLKDAEVSPSECVIDLARDKDRPDFCEYYSDSSKADPVDYCKNYVISFNEIHPK